MTINYNKKNKYEVTMQAPVLTLKLSTKTKHPTLSIILFFFNNLNSIFYPLFIYL